MREVAVVTGPSRGIGRATTLAFARRGLDLALVGRPSRRLEEVAAACADLGVRARTYPCDMGDAAAVERAGKALLEDMGAPRAVVNNAGENVRGPLLHELSVEAWDRLMAVNLRGPFVLCRTLLPAMLQAKRGRFVHISSISGTIGCSGAAAYAASKWGLVGLSKSLAEELRGTGLVSLAILPGSVDTDMLAETPFEPRMTADEVAGAILYHALDAPDAVQGAAVELFG